MFDLFDLQDFTVGARLLVYGLFVSLFSSFTGDISHIRTRGKLKIRAFPNDDAPNCMTIITQSKRGKMHRNAAEILFFISGGKGGDRSRANKRRVTNLDQRNHRELRKRARPNGCVVNDLTTGSQLRSFRGLYVYVRSGLPLPRSAADAVYANCSRPRTPVLNRMTLHRCSESSSILRNCNEGQA